MIHATCSPQNPCSSLMLVFLSLSVILWETLSHPAFSSLCLECHCCPSTCSTAMWGVSCAVPSGQAGEHWDRGSNSDIPAQGFGFPVRKLVPHRLEKFVMMLLKGIFANMVREYENHKEESSTKAWARRRRREQLLWSRESWLTEGGLQSHGQPAARPYREDSGRIHTAISLFTPPSSSFTPTSRGSVDTIHRGCSPWSTAGQRGMEGEQQMEGTPHL